MKNLQNSRKPLRSEVEELKDKIQDQEMDIRILKKKITDLKMVLAKYLGIELTELAS